MSLFLWKSYINPLYMTGGLPVKMAFLEMCIKIARQDNTSFCDKTPKTTPVFVIKRLKRHQFL